MSGFFSQKYKNAILISFFNNFYAGMMILILIALQIAFSQSLNLPATDTALLLSMSSFGTLFTMYFAGSLSDKVGRKNLMIAGVLVYIIYISGFILTTNYTLLMFFAFLAGVGGGLIDSPGKSLIFDAVEGNKGPYLSINQIFFSAGTVFSTTLASYITLKEWSWKYVYGLYLVITIVYLLALFVTKLPSVKSADLKQKGEQSKESWSKTRYVMIILLIIMLLFAINQSIINTWIPQYAVVEKGLSESFGVSLLTYYQIGGVLGAIFIGQWMKKVHTTHFMILSPLVAGITLMAIVFLSLNTIMGYLVLIIGFFLAMYYAYGINMGGLIYPNNTGAASGAVGTMFMFGQTVTIMLSSFFVKNWGLSYLFVACIILIFVLLVFAVYFRKKYFEHFGQDTF